ncbi:uncharacterized protein LOC115225255 isoform X6 [Octopus sinensis]|uniref:Uncharacterized protein LOC115225255 isoform X6 n=1 Tax=Octopus sinensis TaxID=2607531 RepID=A0A7E6FTT8_9MOLL|nr:uncharacterized protein LOC115225255 isoform X6 [Octopus sinensis]
MKFTLPISFLVLSSLAVEAKVVWNAHRNANITKGSQSEVKLGPDTKADETKDSRNGGESRTVTSSDGSSTTIRPDMGTTKEPGSYAAVTSMPNYAVVVLCVLGALKHFFL